MTTFLGRSGLTVALALTVAAFATGCGASTKTAKTPASEGGGGEHAEVGKAAPDLSIQTLNNQGKISIESLQGKIAIIDFWATWCAPCKESFPKLDALSKKLGDKVVIVGVSVDDDKAGVAEFAKNNGATFAVGWDEGHAIAGRWGVKTMPTTFIVDATGTVRFIHDGYHDGETDKMGTEVASIADEGGAAGGATRVAKAEKAAEEPASESAARTERAEEKPTATREEPREEEAAPPPPKKKPKVAKGRAGAKKAPPKKGGKKRR